jgi:hypothetical protein
MWSGYMSDQIEAILEQRGSRYGQFESNAITSQALCDVMKVQVGWANLKPVHREALEMVMHKAARIINGDPDYDDSWVDISGYAGLVVKYIKEKQL